MRVEIGPQEMGNKKIMTVVRDTGERKQYDLAGVSQCVRQLLKEMQERLFQK